LDISPRYQQIIPIGAFSVSLCPRLRRVMSS
jgi:hypothetical protein